MSKIILKYSPPKLRVFSNGYMEVKCFLFHPITGKEHPHRESQGLNRKGATKKEREKTASFIIADMLARLKAGDINPWPELNEVEDERDTMLIVDALKMAWDIVSKSIKKTRTTLPQYRSSYNRFVAAVLELNLNINAEKFTRKHCRLTLERLKTNGATDSAHNQIKRNVSRLFAELEELEIIEYNPLTKISSIKLSEPIRFRPPTSEQNKAIDVHLYENYSPLFLFKSIVMVAMSREDELLGLRKNNINWDKNTATLIGEDVKNHQEKEIVLSPQIINLLKEHVGNHVGNPYVFSTRLLPGKKRTRMETVNYYWRTRVKSKETGLGIDVDLYGLKKYGANLRRKSGEDISTLQRAMGHGSVAVTEIYLTEEKEIAREKLLKNPPDILENVK